MARNPVDPDDPSVMAQRAAFESRQRMRHASGLSRGTVWGIVIMVLVAIGIAAVLLVQLRPKAKEFDLQEMPVGPLAAGSRQ